MAHEFSPKTQEAEVGRSLSLRPIWYIIGVLEQPELQRKILSQDDGGRYKIIPH